MKTNFEYDISKVPAVALNYERTTACIALHVHNMVAIAHSGAYTSKKLTVATNRR